MSFPALERCPHGEYVDRRCLPCRIAELEAATREIYLVVDVSCCDHVVGTEFYLTAEHAESVRKQCVQERQCLDGAFEVRRMTSSPLELGAVYRTPYEPAGLFRVLEIEHQGNGHGITARGVFVGDHPAGYADGAPGRYFVKELRGRKVEPCSPPS